MEFSENGKNDDQSNPCILKNQNPSIALPHKADLNEQRFIPKLAIIYLPFLLAWIFNSWPQVSYWTAWSGSFVIFYLSMSGRIKPLPKDLNVSQQLMRPVFLMQLIFAGYTCCTSVFYFLDAIGYNNFHQAGYYFKPDRHKLEMIAIAQRYYCLGHAAVVTGIFCAMKYPVQKKYTISQEKIVNLLLYMALAFIPIAFIFNHLDGLKQFSYQFNTICFISGSLALAFAIPLHRFPNIILSAILYGYNFYNAFLSGYKEPIIISILVIGIFLYPNYKKTVLLIFVPLLLIVFMLLPTYNRIFRQSAWTNETSAEDASKIALNETLHASSQDENSNWGFLVYRFSEIDMFIRYLETTPKQVPFYGYTMLRQSAEAVVPRIFWPSKPNTERVAMQRVYNAGISNEDVEVSAKPALINDAYLFAGSAGIVIILLLYGITAQLISQKAESLFGGYLLGSALIFSGLFQMFWRGLSFEFLLNSVFWSYISMLLIARLMFIFRILNKAT